MNTAITLHNCGNFDDKSLFSIIIPSWNNLQMLQLCIQSIRKNSVRPHQIIVHVNDGSDGTLEWLKKQSVDYTHSLRNVGVCYALNAAAGLAHTNYILSLNDDMYVCPGWDQHLYDQILQVGHPYFFLSATMIEPVGGTPAAIAPYSYGTSPQHFDEEKLLREWNTHPHHDWSGAAWPPNVVHKELWNMVGGYSIEFSPGFYSDPDFCMKLWKAGVRIFKGVGASRVYHFRSKSTARVTANNGRKTFASKWGFPASYLYKEVLHLGEPYSGELPEFKPTYSARLKAFWQKLK